MDSYPRATRIRSRISFAAAGIGGLASAHAGDVYRQMIQPAWAPPGWNQYAFCWNFHLIPLPDGRTRFISRTGGWGELGDRHPRLGTFINTYLWGWSGTVMTTRMLEVIRACAESKPFNQS